MKISKVEKLSPIARFHYWIKERHAIYLRKTAGLPKPWTDDEILQNYFFTNPYRENDKVTQWFRLHVREPLRLSKSVMFATICFRWFNYIPTGELLQERPSLLLKWDVEKAVSRLSEYFAKGNKVFTGAFNISPSGSKKPKIERVCEDYIQPIWEDRNDIATRMLKERTMEGAFNILSKYPGLAGSGFMSYEAVCDLRYTNMITNQGDAPLDCCSWTNLGPGGVRGLNRILERPVDGPKPNGWLAECVKLLKLTQAKLSGLPPIEMREIEHSLCETDKYERCLFGQGHMKRKYSGVN